MQAHHHESHRMIFILLNPLCLAFDLIPRPDPVGRTLQSMRWSLFRQTLWYLCVWRVSIFLPALFLSSPRFTRTSSIGFKASRLENIFSGFPPVDASSFDVTPLLMSVKQNCSFPGLKDLINSLSATTRVVDLDVFLCLCDRHTERISLEKLNINLIFFLSLLFPLNSSLFATIWFDTDCRQLRRIF